MSFASLLLALPCIVMLMSPIVIVPPAPELLDFWGADGENVETMLFPPPGSILLIASQTSFARS